MNTYYMEPNAVIEKAYDFDTDSFLVVFNGYIASRKNFISVEKAYKNGASCFCCKYSKDRECENDSIPLLCTCKPNNEMKEATEGRIPVFTQQDFQQNDEHECDSRGVCEFFRLKDIKSFQNVSEFMGNLPVSWKWYDEQCDDTFFTGAIEAYCGLLCATDCFLESVREKAQKYKTDNDDLTAEIRGLKGFLKFFNEEIPDVYKRLIEEYRKKNAYE